MAIEVSRVIDAPVQRVFEFLARPANHVALDTSGMLRGPLRDEPIRAVGDVFAMAMNNDDRGEHTIENHVVVFEPDVAIGWAPGDVGYSPAGHTWTYRLTPDGPDRTVVTEIYDWSQFTDQEALPYLPLLGPAEILASLDLLAAALLRG